ncbi:MAG TPA: TonB-dependent receptor [Candidatus Methylomirabilis sp.]|nr:TonB-dependent receptor [Candidatus Methylomirabilis sp.]
MNRPLSIVVAIYVSGTLNPAHAAESESDQSVIVTASRMPQTADDALASVTVITRQDINRQQPNDIVDLLQGLAGVDVARTGGPGSVTSVFLRGTNSDHVLVLVDGVRVNSATTNTFAWESLAPDQIERIEIVRGPRATFYGPDAIGGVIQIFTRRPRDLNARIGAGSFGARDAQIGIGGGDRVQAYANIDYRDNTGFSATNPSAGPFLFNPDSDGFINRSVTAGLNARLDDATTLTLNAWGSRSKVEFDEGPSDNPATYGEQGTVNTTLRHTHSALWTQSLSLGYFLDDQDTVGSFPSRITTHRTTANWQHDLSLATTNLLTLGVDYYHDQGRNLDTSSDTIMFDNSISDAGVYVNDQAHFGDHEFQLGLRRDHHNRFGEHNSGQLAWGWHFAPHWRTLASYGTAFKAPSLNQLFHPGFGGFYAGNPNLKPETSRNVEAGLHYEPSKQQQMDLNVYQTRVDDLIANQGVNNQAININRARLRGVELRHSIVAGAWRAATNFTWQSAIDEQTDTELLRRPMRKLSFRVDRSLTGGGTVGGELVAASSHLDFDNVTNGTTTVPGYGIVNLMFRLPIDRQWTLEGRADNIFDKTYELVSGYNTPSRSYFIAMRYDAAR